MAGGQPFPRGTVTLCLHRNPQGNLGKRAEPYGSFGTDCGVDFGLTCFGTRYTFGKDSNKTQKQPPQSRKLSGCFYVHS